MDVTYYFFLLQKETPSSSLSTDLQEEQLYDNFLRQNQLRKPKLLNQCYELNWLMFLEVAKEHLPICLQAARMAGDRQYPEQGGNE